MKKAVITIIVLIIIVFTVMWLAKTPAQAPVTAPVTTTGGATNSTTTTTTTLSATVTTAPSTAAVTISNFAFSPKALTVKKGTVVTWTNGDSMAHTVTGNTNGPASGELQKGMTYSYTFDTVGTFAYHCKIHPGMTGTVTVTK